jgi:hypothetical protein
MTIISTSVSSAPGPLPQPAAIKAALDWAREHNAISFFDAGDVQANGFQIVEDEQPGKTFSETGASYMGFAVSALMATDVHGLKIQCRRRLITNDLNCFKNRNQLIIHLSFYRCANIIRHQKNY